MLVYILTSAWNRSLVNNFPISWIFLQFDTLPSTVRSYSMWHGIVHERSLRIKQNNTCTLLEKSSRRHTLLRDLWPMETRWRSKTDDSMPDATDLSTFFTKLSQASLTPEYVGIIILLWTALLQPQVYITDLLRNVMRCKYTVLYLKTNACKLWLVERATAVGFLRRTVLLV